MLDKFASGLCAPRGHPDPDIAMGDAGKHMRPTGPGETPVPVQGGVKRIRDRHRDRFCFINEDQTTQKDRETGTQLEDALKRRKKNGKMVSSGARCAYTLVGGAPCRCVYHGRPLCR